MKQLGVIFAIAILLFITSSCHLQQRREARAGLDAAVAQLPKLEGFDTVKVVYQEFCFTDSGCTSCYARAYLIIGSSLPVEKALDVYVEALQLQGWSPRELQFDTERSLMRGMHELIIIWSGEPGADLDQVVDYARLRTVYKSLIFVSLDFRVPGWDEC